MIIPVGSGAHNALRDGLDRKTVSSVVVFSVLYNVLRKERVGCHDDGASPSPASALPLIMPLLVFTVNPFQSIPVLTFTKFECELHQAQHDVSLRKKA